MSRSDAKRIGFRILTVWIGTTLWGIWCMYPHELSGGVLNALDVGLAEVSLLYVKEMKMA